MPRAVATDPPDASSPIRVFRLFSRLNVGGPALHVLILTAGLRSRGYATRLVVGREASREGNLLDLAAEKGVVCIQLAALGREIRPLADVKAFWNLVRMLREYRPHVVHTHTAKAGLLGRLAARVVGVPVVVHTYHGHVLRGYFGPVRTTLFRAAERLMGRVSHALVAVSESVKDDLVGLGVAGADKIRVVPLGLELESLTGTLPKGGLRREAGFAADAPIVGIVGRLVAIKDLGVFLDAAARVLHSRPDVRFAVVGDGDERQRLEDEARRLGLDDRVYFFGWRRDMDRVYGDLDLVVNCSRNEGTPVALIEALAAGRPVVATRVGGTPDLLGGGARGTLVPPGDPAALAGAILEALEGQGAAREQARRGREYVLRRHSAARLIDDLDGLYRQLLATARQAAA